MKTHRELIQGRIRESIATKQRLLESSAVLEVLERVARMLTETYRRGGRMLLFGNGGSAADAQHIAAELVGGFTSKDRRALPAEALTVNTSVLTAIANDYEPSDVFARQVEALGRPGDVAIGISTSGNSVNVVRALEVAKTNGLITVGLTGASGGKLAGVVDYCVKIPSDTTPRIQEAHILLGHILCELIERQVGGEPCSGATD
jgi:D-sedoheptulose 7-phosphate isomerase